ncbi:hypothetical protein BO224_00120 [Erysipelotrichaceae bacterium NYU-BL-E8]|uniref:Uncharacterized protein n=1 Tax=Ileibacterium valens TaxID=1862668 RepID=A0A1U7NGH2_9FIRM|nr:hypothetical protein BM735_09790 [Erysipelotrichaceae bacterium NYU-BL-F16]OLU40232.1 hypothetical protein BO222_05445 [Ileibacterium valens]OLU43441.1 hypothetical protein BO224_00120 [Erysipelotrichaceae bacterium NYU-BL-E8]
MASSIWKIDRLFSSAGSAFEAQKKQNHGKDKLAKIDHPVISNRSILRLNKIKQKEDSEFNSVFKICGQEA